MTESVKLNNWQRFVATMKIAVTAYRAAPMAVILQIVGVVISSVIPIITTFFAAVTTTTLADAYVGKVGAGERAIELVIITSILGVIMFAWSTVEGYLSKSMEYRINAAISDQMYEQFLSLAFWRYDDKDTADLYEKASRFANFFPGVFRSVASIVSGFISAIIAVVALAFVSWWLAILVFIAILPGVIIQFRLSRLQTKQWQENIQPRRIMNWIEYRMMQPENISELRLYGLVKSLLSLRSSMRDKDEKVQVEFERQFIWKKLVANVIETVAELAALIWITIQIINRTQPVGQFLYVQQIVSRVTTSTSSFLNEVNRIDEDLANLFDYQRFMDLPRGISGDKVLSQAPSNVTLENVSFKYATSESDVIKDISLTINAGQHIAIVGENGAGKSTLIKLIIGLYEPSRGYLTLDNVPLSDYDISSWHKQLGILSQDFVRYDFANARDNITYGDVSILPSQMRVDNAIVKSESSFLYKLPRGLDNYVDQWMEDDEGHKGQDLSGGQWQRLALARSFYRQAPIVILDEPTSAIDALAESRIFKHLMSSKDKTIITISHRLTTIQKADIVYMLKDGSIVESGTAAELIAKKSEFYHMFESQIK